MLIDFQNHRGAIHLVVDGWTAPFALSYLGIVVVWFDKSRIWRRILEFIQYASLPSSFFQAF